jgi:hypothetical protein
VNGGNNNVDGIYRCAHDTPVLTGKGGHMYRGSRKHILDWVERPDFTGRLSQLPQPTGAIVGSSDLWMPKGHGDDTEARLEQFGPQVLPTVDWNILQDWWLVAKRGAKRPEWDLASTCTTDGQRGLVLVEAKAHTKELESKGKTLQPDASDNTRKNHERIGSAIEEASGALAKAVQGVNISRDTHCQLANRVAFTWKVASLGVPVVLLYLGFLGDETMSDVGEPFADDGHWQQTMRTYLADRIPEGFLDRWIDCGQAQMQMIIRSLAVG